MITLGSGRFHLDLPVVIDAPGIVLRGRGWHESILDFSAVTTGSGDGIVVTGDRFTLQDVAIVNPPGDAVRLQKARDLAIRRVRIDWPGTPNARNGGYGLYPVECQDIVIEDNVIRGASDSGIYVGQSRRALVQRNEVFESVAGIQIENSVDVEVRENQLHHNTAGLLAFALPELAGDTRRVRISGNRIANNNGPNFASPGARVAAIPPGSGLILMAADEVDVRENRIADHQTTNLSIFGYGVLQERHGNRSYDPFSDAIWIHHNRFEGGGGAPQGPLAETLRPHIGLPFPDIVFDGSVDSRNRIESSLPADRRLYIGDNGDADFIQIDLERFFRGDVEMSRSLSPYAGAPRVFPRPARPERAKER